MTAGFFPLQEAAPADWRFKQLTKAQRDGKCTVSTVLQWYNKENNLSPHVLALIDVMLQIEPKSRANATAVLAHEWFREPSVASTTGGTLSAASEDASWWAWLKKRASDIRGLEESG